jgi:hypothetical protein
MKVERGSFVILLCLLVFSVSVNVAWYSYTGFIRDDAFITFRYAQNIADEKGFVYNMGERVYGTSSPGLALLLAGWLKLFPNHPVNGALGLNILAGALSLLLMWKLLESLSIEHRGLSLFILIWSDKLLLHSMEGMETPLVISCMLASLYFISREQLAFAGVTAGLMLWFRLDSGLWIVVLAIIGWMRQRRRILTFILTTGITYLPWLIFAWFYFGNIIPQTAIAKQVAYGLNAPPWTHRMWLLLSWFSPFTVLTNHYFARIVAFLTIMIAWIGLWAYRQRIWLCAFGIFFVLQGIALVALNMTVEQRYFVTDLYVLLVLFGLGLGIVWDAISKRFNMEWKWGGVLAVLYGMIALTFAFPRVQHIREQQLYIYHLSLKQLGIWLRENSSPNSTVYLEPLGYVGYYSERIMLDDVGFVTPVIVPLKRAGLDSFFLAHYLNPDYIALHCDDAKRAPQGYPYQMVIRFDPLGFEAEQEWEDKAVQRNACYEIHAKKPVH